MNGTPRLRSGAFPSTPQSTRRNNLTPQKLPDITQLRPAAPTRQSADNDGPLIPTGTLDAPTQRLYVVGFYLALVGWKMYDHFYLKEEETESLWLFMKWVAFDGIFLFGLPELRIPWLEWSSATMLLLFLAHAALDAVLMFRIQLPLGAGLAAVGKVFYDRELGVSGHHVKQSSILHNSSLILGKQIIHILPEGSAILNPARTSFCLDSTNQHVYLPIQINQTTPVSIDLLRHEFDGATNETIHISAKEIKKLMKDATRQAAHPASNQPLLLRYPTKKTGRYMLAKVMDESKLEVQRKRVGDTIVVTCPQAIIKSSTPDACKGDLSSIDLEVTGTPPLRIKYRKITNQREQEAHFQSIQPDDFVSPLIQQSSDALAIRNTKDISWARAQTVTVPLREHMGESGKWVYSMDEVEDAFGNIVSYSERQHDDQDKPSAKAAHLHQVVTVHERPIVVMRGCDSQHPLKVAKGQSTALPVQYGSTAAKGNGGFLGTPYNIEYRFTPEGQLLSNGDHGETSQIKSISIKNQSQRPTVQEAGLYTLHSVSTGICAGEVLEPASCLLQNPAEPSLRIDKEEIFDKCANKPIGLRVDFHLTGTPPFNIQYQITKKDSPHHVTHTERVNGLRGQIELTPPTAGHYTYKFFEISDDVYKGHQLTGEDMVIEQDVKPSASANFKEASPSRKVCIDQAVTFEVALRGEGPFTVDYELVRGNNRKRHSLKDINGDQFIIDTGALTKGGDYTLALASVTDRMGCKEFLKQEAKINVRHQRPKVSFGQIEGSRGIKTLQGKTMKLPLKLTGEAPWTVRYRNLRDPEHSHKIKVDSPNGLFATSEEGMYELLEVNDAICPGAVDENAKKFSIDWIERPQLRIPETSYDRVEGDKYIKNDVCEGEDDLVNVHFSGAPPFQYKYDEIIAAERGGKSKRSKAITAALGVSSITLDTSQAGVIDYVFTELADDNYDHSSKHFTQVTIQQRVNARPSARFNNPGRTYSYCSVESAGEEVIPITLEGVPPFAIDVEIKHHGSARPEIFYVKDINKNTHELRVPHQSLHLGNSAVSIRRVTDSRGCSRIIDNASPRVQIAVHDAPTIRSLENQEDFCVGDRISFALSGQAPFQVYYEFNGVARKASSGSTTFKRLAEKPGTFTITGVSDSGSSCRASTNIEKKIHGMPSVRVGKGVESQVDIHEGGEAEITFDFGGTPPFEFTWTRSTNARRGQRSEVLEMRSELSQDHHMAIRASEEGTYEVVSIKDRYCAYAKEGIDLTKKKGKLLTY
jgi:nucleoporin POM152